MDGNSRGVPRVLSMKDPRPEDVMSRLSDIDLDLEPRPECRSAAPGSQGQANEGAREHIAAEVVVLRVSWTSAAPGSQGEANMRARRNRRE
jgi:hypothetical protein